MPSLCNCKVLLLSALLISSLLASELYSEKLEIYPLQSSSFAPKSLWHFTFEFQSIFDPNSHITEEAIPPRSILESIFVYSNATDLRIQVANGKPNSFLLDDGSFYFSLPKEGKTVYADQYASWGNLMYQIHEIFSLSIQHLAEKNYYLYNLDFGSKQINQSERREHFPNYEKAFFYGNDPVDYICNDFIEKIQTFAPCRGSKGLFTLLKMPDIFGSDYVSSSIALHYDPAAKKSYFKVNFDVIGNPDLLNNKLTEGKCEGFSSSNIIDYRPKQESGNQADYEIHDDFSLFKIDTLPSDLYSKNILSSQRYLTNARFHSKAELIHEITNSHSSQTIRGIVSEYLHSFTHPIFHQISLKMNNNQSLSVKKHMEIEYLKSAYTLLKFDFEIPPQSTLRIKIPFEKLMRSFENHPHDPARGEDIIPSVIFYRTINLDENKGLIEKIYRLESNDILVEMPHSDLSMPFTIIAVVMAAFGFLSMTIYRAIFENPKKTKETKLTILKNKIKDKCLKRKEKIE